MEEKLIDLTAPEFQGCFGHDIVEELNGPGFYRIPLRDDDLEGAFSEEYTNRLQKIADEMNAANAEKGEYTSLTWYTLPGEIRNKTYNDMLAEGKVDYRPVEVHIDKVLFVRDGNFQMIHTTDPGIFKESDWAYYNGAERQWKDSICLEEIIDELMDEYGPGKAKKMLGNLWQEISW